MFRIFLNVLAIALFASASPLQAATVALVGGRLIDGFGGPPLANSVILIEGDRIKAIGQVGKLQVPADAEVISTEGMDVKVKKLAEAGVNIIKLIDQDQMTPEEVKAIVDEAHKHKLPVVAHGHRPEEIRRGLAAGADCFEHTGLATAPGYPDDVLKLIAERTAKMSLGPLFWCPTIEGFLNYQPLLENPEQLDDPAWQAGVPADIVADIKASIARPGQLSYYQITPLRAKTVANKFKQLQESGVVLLIGTDSGIPMKFHSGSTWKELDAWVNKLGVDPMTAIRAATYWPAVQMKVDKDYGSVSEGKYADIIAVKGDVLRYIDLLQRVDLVVKHGKRMK